MAAERKRSGPGGHGPPALRRAGYGLRKRALVRRPADSLLGDDRADVARRRHVESGMSRADSGGGNRLAREGEHLANRALFDRDPGSVEEGTGLGREHPDRFPRFDRGPDDPERASVTAGGERARVAMGEHRRAAREKLGSMTPEAPRRLESLGGDHIGLGEERRLDPFRRFGFDLPEAVLHPVERAEEVDRGRPRRRENVARGLEALLHRRRLAASHRESRSVSGGHSDRRRSAHGHLPDRESHLRSSVERQPDLARGEQSLVEKPEQRTFAVDRDEKLRQRDSETTSPTPPERGSATAVRVPSGPHAIAWTRPIGPLSGSRSSTVCPIRRSASIQPASNRLRSIWILSGKSCW